MYKKAWQYWSLLWGQKNKQKMKRKHLKSGPKVETECERKIVVKAGKKTENNVGRKRVRKREREREREQMKGEREWRSKQKLCFIPIPSCCKCVPKYAHISLIHFLYLILCVLHHTLSPSLLTLTPTQKPHMFSTAKRDGRERKKEHLPFKSQFDKEWRNK